MVSTINVPFKYQKELEELRMFDDDFFRKVAKDKRIIEVVLEAILGNDVHIHEHHTQYDMNYAPRKSIVPDAYVITNKGYTSIEVERHKQRLIPKRARYCSSLLDVDSSKKGMEYEELKPIKVIFLCEKDPFERGLPYYCERDYIEELGCPYDNEREIIYVNGEYRGNDPIGILVHDLNQTRADEMYNSELRNVMRYYKETEEGVKEMCEIFERIAVRNKEEGIQESNVNAIRNVMETLNYTLKEAMTLLKIPKEEYDMYKELVLK